MTYTDEIVRPLVDTLTRTAALPAFQLAAHIPNLAFWMSEIRHALYVIDGYSKRFNAMLAAQNQFSLNFSDEVQRHGQDERPPKPLRRSMSQTQADRLKRECIAAGIRLLNRCLEEGFIDSSKFIELHGVMETKTQL